MEKVAVNNVRYERLREEHLAQVVPFHVENLGGQLAGFGGVFARCFYEDALKLDGSFGWVALMDGLVVGFVFGNLLPGSLPARMVRQYPLRWISRGISISCRHPINAIRTARAFLGHGEGNSRSHNPRLHFIAVSASERKRGVGAVLMERFGQTAAENGCSSFELSVEVGNAEAIRFYENHGGKALCDYDEAGLCYRLFVFQVG